MSALVVFGLLAQPVPPAEAWAQTAIASAKLRIAIEVVGNGQPAGRKWPDDLQSEIKNLLDLQRDSWGGCLKDAVEWLAPSGEDSATLVEAAFGECEALEVEAKHGAELFARASAVRDPDLHA